LVRCIGIDRHGPIVRRVYIVANALTVVLMTLFIPCAYHHPIPWPGLAWLL
jgi:hypothetical protein